MEEFAKTVDGLQDITDVIMFVHGYTVQPSEILTNFGGKPIQNVFDPHVLVMPVVWSSVTISNTEVESIVGYVVDRARAEKAGECLHKFFRQAQTECKKSGVVRKVFAGGKFHLLAHSMGCFVTYIMGQKTTRGDLEQGNFDFGVIVIKQANAAPDWFNENSENFKQSGSKIVKIANRVLLLWSPDDATLKALAESKLATKIYGSNDLGLTGPGNVNHVKNLKVINASTQFPGLDNYHAYLGLQEFGNLVVGEIKKVSLLYPKVA
mmetsp:Transcript_22891/g.36746  ORF Transcript_22891/g.36746 Transcript_22891/m.36746 type:complete len:265 (-) Transcript_22891:76-870(-)